MICPGCGRCSDCGHTAQRPLPGFVPYTQPWRQAPVEPYWHVGDYPPNITIT